MVPLLSSLHFSKNSSAVLHCSPPTLAQVRGLPIITWPNGVDGIGAPQIFPFTTAVRQEAGFSGARFGYSRTASRDRYLVRSWNFASSIGPMFGMPWFGGSHIRSGSESLASSVANFSG